METFLITIISVSILSITGCVTQNPYQKNMADLTRKNVSYLKSLGYRITSVDDRTGYIQAYNLRAGKSPEDLKIFYSNQQINPYKAVNSEMAGHDISSITAYWLPGRDQLNRRDREIAEADSAGQSTLRSYTPGISSPALPDLDASGHRPDIIQAAAHKTL